MLRSRGATTVDAVDTKLLVAAVPELIKRWRALEFHRGMVIDRDGRRREGLQVESGTHPRAGTRYRVVTDPQAPSAGTVPAVRGAPGPADQSTAPLPADEVHVDVIADDLDRIGLRFTNPEQVTDVELRRPLKPDRVTARTVVHIDEMWPFRGDVTVDVRLDLAALPHPDQRSDEPQLVVDVRHPRLRASVKVLVNAVGGRWDVSFDVAITGRGLSRLLFRPGVPFIGRTLRREMAEAIDQLPGQVVAFNRELGRLTGPAPTPSDLAGSILDLFLAEIVDTLPTD
jgi:hypothetical protein